VAAEEKKAATRAPNLSSRQLRVYTGPVTDPGAVPIQSPAELDRMAVRVRRLAADLDGAAVIPLRSVLQRGVKSRGFEGVRVRFTVGLRRQVGKQSFSPGGSLYVATPALLGHLGVDPATVDPSTDFLADPSVPTGELVIPVIEPTAGDRLEVVRVTNVQRIDSQEYLGGHTDDGVPASFITLEGLRRHGWSQIPSGWLVESSRPLTGEQIANARASAAAGGLTIEARRETPSFTPPIAIATAAGAFLALAILAMTVGLIRSEGAADLRLLTATGATSGIRRALTAATAGALALLGALLGVTGAYLALGGTYVDKLDYLGRIPVLYLVVMVIGIPLAAAAAGWLFAGREPPAIARPVFE
jgi:putative ABC transport system permease protein